MNQKRQRTLSPSRVVILMWLILWVMTVPLFHVHAPDINPEAGTLSRGVAHTVFSPDLPGEYSHSFDVSPLTHGQTNTFHVHLSQHVSNYPEIGIALQNSSDDRKTAKQAVRKGLGQGAGELSWIKIRLEPADMVLAICCVGLAIGTTALVAQSIGALIYHSWNLWFEADTYQVFSMMTVGGAGHSRLLFHPLFLWVTYPALSVLRHVAGLSPLAAVQVLLMLNAGTWMALFVILLRTIGCPRLETGLLALVALISAAWLFIFPIPETYPFGSVSLLLVLVWVALARGRPTPLWSQVGINLLAIGMTVTNWMASAIATLTSVSWRRAVLVFAIMGLLLVGAWHVQASRLGVTVAIQEGQNIFPTRAGGPLHILRSMFFHTIVMPAITIRPDDGKTGVVLANEDTVVVPERMVTQPSWPGSASGWGRAALVCWMGLLLLGVRGLAASSSDLRLRLVLGATLIAQVALHLLYGDETFLYSPHFLPLLLTLVALGCLSGPRPLVLMLLGILVVTDVVNNLLVFDQAVQFMREHDSYH